ncbi:cytochrome c biogenesis protein CcsA [Rhizosphaericola mali]|uniref:Heme exporter protein C n=1 Tax=Rhizosphaericola mali TaxID=2545455 RepID=A0A5P2FXK3_9BACT|nr:cytochrome c biogenesis protein CcsA [Rhizosphaericola mali]QES88206.1 ABC transporter permease [Rhizosphaericola mali]
MMRQIWWKIITFLILLYVGTMGFLVAVPKLDGRLQQSIRNLFFHVPMWICMMILFTFSVVHAVKYLKDGKADADIYSLEFARTGCVFAVLGLGTGMIWAKYQWGAAWSSDPKQNGATIALLIYFAYFVLRGAITDDEKKAKIGAVYNIFAYCMLFPTIWILPRLTESLHPGGQGSEGNPGLNPDDTTAAMKTVMIPAFIGWSLVGIWIATLRVRYKLLLNKVEDRALENQ